MQMSKIEKYFGKQFIPVRQIRYTPLLAAVILIVLAGSIEIDWYQYDLSPLRNFLTVFLGIVVQSFPFLLAGSLISSLVHGFVRDEIVERFFHRRSVLAVPAALAAAFLFPVCDCASVPVAARFCRKGFPLPSVIVFMFASPIINPIVIASTWYAFGDVRMVAARVVSGIVIPVIIGTVAHFVFRGSSVLSENHSEVHNHECGCGHGEDSCCTHHKKSRARSAAAKTADILSHTGSELVSVMPFIVIGGLVSASVQTFVPKDVLFGGLSGIALQSLVMIAAAFLMSVCSTSDAFFSRLFMSHVGAGPAAGFMIAGPMIDLKNVLMMSRYFKKRFIAFAVAAVAVTVFASSFALQFVLGGKL
jgi:uncharacterized protein